MADLSIRVGGQSSRLLPLGTVVLAHASFSTESVTMGDSATGSLGLYKSLTESVAMLANYVTTTWDGTGDTSFNQSPDHATVINYEALLRLSSGVGGILDTWQLGVPTPDANGVIVVPLAMFFSNRAPGNYTVSIKAYDATGSTDSAEGNVFTLPLAFPYNTWERAVMTDTVTPSLV